VDSSRSSLEQRLSARTKRFKEMVKNPGDVKNYAKKTFDVEDFAKRYEVIYCCEYLGFLDAEEKKVGCLLHPQQNSDIDLRTCSFYGQEICAGHICPSHHFIPQTQSQILIKIIGDWYLYGLCLTDIDLVKTYFRLLADRVGEELKPGVFNKESLKNIAVEFFNWKITWPFRSSETNRLGKYYFDGSQYMISYIDYTKFGKEVSVLDPIFLSLSSSFQNAAQIEAAESLVWSNIESFISAYRRHF
jgi:hypothetical protein